MTPAEREAREPQPSIFCACGAQWHGKYATGLVIEAHRRRADGVEPNRIGCRIISHDDFKAFHRCACAECRPRRQSTPQAPREPYQNRAKLLAEVARLQGLLDCQQDVVSTLEVLVSYLRSVERWPVKSEHMAYLQSAESALRGAIPPSPQEPDK